MTDPRAAALYVCAHADTVDDAAMLLDALGLIADGVLAWPQPGARLPIANPKMMRIGRP